jgi:hypothetical protein
MPTETSMPLQKAKLLLVSLRSIRSELHPQPVFPLIGVAGLPLLLHGQIAKETKSIKARSGDPAGFNLNAAAQKLAKIVPVEITPLLKLLHQPFGRERVAGLPELQNHQPSDQVLIERRSGKYFWWHERPVKLEPLGEGMSQRALFR